MTLLSRVTQMRSLGRQFGGGGERRKLIVNVGKCKVQKLSLSGEQEPLRLRLRSEELKEVRELTCGLWGQRMAIWRRD